MLAVVFHLGPTCSFEGSFHYHSIVSAGAFQTWFIRNLEQLRDGHSRSGECPVRQGETSISASSAFGICVGTLSTGGVLHFDC